MEFVRKHRHKLLWLLPLVILLVWVLLNQSSSGQGEAILFLEPPKGTFFAGDEIEVLVKLNSGKYANAIEGEIKLRGGALEVISLSKSGSLISIWISEPIFSEKDGVIQFSGIIPNPGFKGEGKIFSIKLRAKKAGRGSVDFNSASVLANDENGTEILKQKTGAKYTILDKNLPSPDLNNDGKVSMSDISILISAWGSSEIENHRYDMNQDGKVNLLDLSILISKITAQ